MSKATKITLIIVAGSIIFSVFLFAFLGGNEIDPVKALSGLGLFASGVLTALGLRKK